MGGGMFMTGPIQSPTVLPPNAASAFLLSVLVTFHNIFQTTQTSDGFLDGSKLGGIMALFSPPCRW